MRVEAPPVLYATMPLSLLQPLGILVGIPLLEALRHIFTLSYGSPVPVYANIGTSRDRSDLVYTISFSLCCFVIIMGLGSGEKKTTHK